MIGLYYTGARQYLKEQIVPKKSLGGSISSSRIPNKKLNNLFSSITESLISRGSEEMRCIAIKNEGTLSISEITLAIELTEDVVSTFNGFLIMPAQDNCLAYYFEELSSGDSIPSVGDLVPLNNLESINVTGLDWKPGEYLGFWLQRVVGGVDSIPTLGCPECTALQALFEAGTVAKKEELYKINFSFTEIPVP